MGYDVIVIGSGFGGAITGCRLAEKGYSVLILERGRRWTPDTYPRNAEDPWIWNQDDPKTENGWLDLRFFRKMAVAQGAAVGGGSLIYASISVEAPRAVFDQGWPAEITYDELKPYYDQVASFMNVQKMPDNQRNPRTSLMKEAAENIGQGDRFEMIPLAVSFDPNLELDPDNPPDPSLTNKFTNSQGVEQGTCVHLGNCDIGCDVQAKNTLDLNYIPWAEKHGAQVRPLHMVTNIVPEDGGYRVWFDRLDQLNDGEPAQGSETARIVIIAAASLGSTELLLRCRDTTKSLPNVSQFLGRHWSSNGDFLTPAAYLNRKILPTVGPTISSAINFLDRSQSGQAFWVEDGGFPNLLRDYALKRPENVHGLFAKTLITQLWDWLLKSQPGADTMLWFSQGIDAGNGVFRLKREFGIGPERLHLDWDVTDSKPCLDAIVDMHVRLSQATGGTPLVPPTWTLGQSLITPHPLGGCCIGTTAADGVVDHRGEVFGYNNLYVTDGASVPTPLGVNPSRTIGALAERAAKIIADQGR